MHSITLISSRSIPLGQKKRVCAFLSTHVCMRACAFHPLGVYTEALYINLQEGKQHANSTDRLHAQRNDGTSNTCTFWKAASGGSWSDEDKSVKSTSSGEQEGQIRLCVCVFMAEMSERWSSETGKAVFWVQGECVCGCICVDVWEKGGE